MPPMTKPSAFMLYWILHHLLLYTGAGYCQLKLDYSWQETECPPEDATMMVNQVAWGAEGRAYKTLPSGLVLAPSHIDGAGFGVLSEIFIPKYTWLGEYEGQYLAIGDEISWYSWTGHRNGKPVVYIDGHHLHLSSYHRYVNTPLRYQDENVAAMECYGRIYYMTTRHVHPGQELLVFYGVAYAQQLHIDLNDYYQVPGQLRAAGLDLREDSHRNNVHYAGFDLHQLKDASPSWLPVFLGETILEGFEP